MARSDVCNRLYSVPSFCRRESSEAVKKAQQRRRNFQEGSHLEHRRTALMDDQEFLSTMSIAMIASFLDARFKKLPFVAEIVGDAVMQTVQKEVDNLPDTDPNVRPVVGVIMEGVNQVSATHKKNILEELLGEECENEHQIENEDYVKMKSADVSKNPFSWWREREPHVIGKRHCEGYGFFPRQLVKNTSSSNSLSSLARFIRVELNDNSFIPHCNHHSSCYQWSYVINQKVIC